MRNRRFLFGVLAATLLFGCPIRGFAVSLHWKITSIYVKPQPAVAGSVTVGCAWTAEVAGSGWKFQDEILVDSSMNVWDVATNANVDYFVFMMELSHYPPNGKQYAFGTVTSDFNGSREHAVNLHAGLHKASCQIGGTGDEIWPSDYQEFTFDVHVPTVSSSAQPAAGETVMATTPQLPPFWLPPPERWITPVITPPSPRSGEARPADERRRSRLQPPMSASSAGRLHAFRAGEKLFLKDGRALTIRGTTLILLDREGNVLRSFPPGVVVLVGSSADVSVQSGPFNVPLGVARRN